ncbi:MAG: hypothetical protein AABZ55_01290 [Bdellovibrionota bacterium]
MKPIYLTIFAMLSLATIETKAHAFIWECEYVRDCRTDGGAMMLWTLSTTLTGPLAIIFDGEINLSQSEAREIVLSQADQVLNGQSSAIAGSNYVNVLAKKYGAKDDEAMARALRALDAWGSEFSDENIREALR